jgi:hypothetical protein
MADQGEVSFYADQSGVRVTDKRVIIGNKTYSMANISSVSTKVEKPSLFGPILFIAIGILLFFGGLSQRSAGAGIVGAIIAALGYFWYRGSKPMSHLRIASSSGESTPLKSINQQWINGIAQAINEAMIRRA